MPADDHPFDALAKQLELERMSLSPVSEAICRIASGLDLPWPFDKAVKILKEHASADSFQKIYLMLETCMSQVRKLESGVGGLRTTTESESQLRAEISKDLMIDAARKAENTRARERVKRIGLILGNAIADPKPIDADEIEEMTRVAVDLSDQDVRYLKELIRIEGGLLDARDHIPRYDGYMAFGVPEPIPR